MEFQAQFSNPLAGNFTTELSQAMQDPTIEYRSRLERWQATLNRHRFHERLLSIARLVVFVAGVIVLGFFEAGFFSGIGVLLPAILFGILVVKHDHVLRKRDQAAMAIQFYERGLSRIRDTWMERDDPVHEIKVDPNHLYAWDLDLFGPQSLFQLLCTARTIFGVQTLAEWLLHPASTQVIKERQDAVHELRDFTNLREDLAIVETLPSRNRNDQKSSEIDFLLKWAEQTSNTLPPSAAVVGIVLTILTLCSLLTWYLFNTGPYWFVVALIAQIIFSSIFRKRIRNSLLGLERAGSELQLLSGILARTEPEKFNSTLLQNWKLNISADGELPSRRIAKLNRLIEFYDWGRNPYFATFAGLLLWRTQIGFAVEAWRRSNGALVRKWIQAIGEMEALVSLSCYSYEHPEDPFPEIAETGRVLKVEAVGHPL